MGDNGSGEARLERARGRLVQWRERHGGPGIPLPDELWAEAVEVARVVGIASTARALRIDRARLAARMHAEDPTSEVADRDDEGTAGFVEIDAGRLCLSPRTLLRFQSRDGERLEVELAAGTLIDVAALAEAFWSRRR